MGWSACFHCSTWWTRRARPEPHAPIAPATSATSTRASDDSSFRDSNAPEQTAAAERFVDEQWKQKQKQKNWKQKAEEQRQKKTEAQQHVQMHQQQHKLAREKRNQAEEQQRRRADEERQQAEEQQQRLRDQQQAQVADEERLRELLEGLGLPSYADAIVAQGYNSAELIGAMTKTQVNELADVVGMKPVHKKKFAFYMVQHDLDDDEGESSGVEDSAKAAPPADATSVVAGASTALATPQPMCGFSTPATTLSVEPPVVEGFALGGWAGSAVPVLDPGGGPLAC